MNTRALLVFTVFVGSVLPGRAQDIAQSPRLTLEQIFSSPYFTLDRFGPARWLNEDGYTTIERSDNGTTELILYDAASGRKTVIVNERSLIPENNTQPLVIENYEWSNDNKKLLLFTNSRRVWRQNTRGDFWVLDLEEGNLHQLGGDAPPSTLMFAKFSPDGEHVGYVRQNNLYVENLSTGDIRALTEDGSETIINGTFDWVYEEEFGLRDGFRWSPDGRRIAYWQLDASGIGTFHLINNTDSIYSKLIPLQYPKAGTVNSASRIGVVSATGGPTTWFIEDDDPRNHYPARMDWAASSDEILVQHLNRDQNTNSLLLGDANTGTYKTLFVEQDGAWLDVVDDLMWTSDAERFTWVSEREGWRQLFLVSRDGLNSRNVTSGAYDVIEISHIDEDAGWLYFIASPDNATQRYLYRTKLNGTGTPERLTPQDNPGTHSYQIAPGAAWAVHTYSSFSSPPVVELVSLPDHVAARVLVDNARLKERVANIERGGSRFFRVTIDNGVDLDGWELRPPDFDPSKKYPVLFFVYGEPAGQTVLDRWPGARYLWHTMLTQNGYVVMSIDNRGTPAPRGRDWRKMVHGAIGVLASQDQAAALRKIQTWEYVDPDRIGIWGWSGGGSMTLNMMFRHPEMYHVGMSVAPVPDQRLYDTIYQERYMGQPQNNPEGYRVGSPITYAQNLEGDLLLVHGTGDDNVHYQGSELLINKLISHNKPFTMMAYPNRSHGIYEGSGTTRHLYELLTHYLTEHLPAGPR